MNFRRPAYRSFLTCIAFLVTSLQSDSANAQDRSSVALRTPANASKYSGEQYVWAASAANAIRSSGEYYRVHTTAIALEQYRALKAKGEWNQASRDSLKRSMVDLNENQSRIMSVAQSRKNYDARGFVASSLMQGMSLEERTRFRDGLSAESYGKIVETPLNAVSILKVNPKAALAIEGLKVGLSLSDDADRLTLGKKEQVESIGYQLSLADRYGKKSLAIFADSKAAAAEDADFMDVLRTITFNSVPFSPSATLEEMKTENPIATEFAAQLDKSRAAEKGGADAEVQSALLQERKTQRANIERLRKELIEELKAKSKTPKEIEEQLARLEEAVGEWKKAQQDELAKKAAAEDALRETQQLAKEHHQNMRKLADIDAGFQILGTIGGLVKDPQTANILRKTSAAGSIGVEMVSSILNFQSSRFNPDAISSAILTGNLVSGVGALIQLFSGEPSTDEMILQQLAETREQIEKFRQEMHERLNAIDKKLDIALVRLDQILELAQSNHQQAMGQMADLKRTMGLQYSDLRVYLETHFTHVHEEQLRDSINTCFESQEFFVDGPSAETLDECLRVFVRYSTRKVFENFSDPVNPQVFLEPSLLQTQLLLPESKTLNLLKAYARRILNRQEMDSIPDLPDVRVFQTATAATILLLQDHREVLQPRIRSNALTALKEKVFLFENFRRKIGNPEILWNSAIHYRGHQGRFMNKLLNTAHSFRKEQGLFANDPATGLSMDIPIFYETNEKLVSVLEGTNFVTPIRRLDQGDILTACPGARSIGDERWANPTMDRVYDAFQHAPNFLKVGTQFGFVKLRLCADVPTIPQASARPSPHHGTGNVSLRLIARYENGAEAQETVIAERQFQIQGWGGHDIVSMRVRWQEQQGAWKNNPFANFQASEFLKIPDEMKHAIITQITKEVALRRLRLVSEWVNAIQEDRLPDEVQSILSVMDSSAKLHHRILRFAYPEASDHDDQLFKHAFSSTGLIQTKEDVLKHGIEWLQTYWPDIQNPDFELLKKPGATDYFLKQTRAKIDAWGEYETRLKELNPDLELSDFQIQAGRIDMLQTLLFPTVE